MTTVILVAGAILVLVFVGFFWLKRSDGPPPRRLSKKSEQIAGRKNLLPLVRLVPGESASCESARALQTHRFNNTQAPRLPLDDCTMPHLCGCQLQPVPERRSGRDRRTVKERREVIRYDPNEEPRRKNTGRRKEDKIWDHES